MFNSALNVICDEHRSLVAVVRGLQHLSREIQSGQATDFALLRAIVNYLDEFPQKLHHPKEETYLFGRLQSRTRSADPLIAELRAQHLAGAGHVNALRVALEDFASGKVGGQSGFSSAAEQFADGILQHMSLEESVLIPLARRYLRDSDWVEIGAAFGENGDPRFVADPEHGFGGLFARIMSLAPFTASRTPLAENQSEYPLGDQESGVFLSRPYRGGG